MGNSRVSQAIERTKQAVPGYFEKTCTMRTEERAGSYYEGLSPTELEARVVGGDWTEWPEAPGLAPGCTAFRLDLPGVLGALLLSEIPLDTPVTLADPKGTGEALAEVKLADLGGDVDSFQRVDFSTLILGDEQGLEVCFTFHPGAPLPHDPKIKHDGGPRTTTAGEALALGLKTVKIISA